MEDKPIFLDLHVNGTRAPLVRVLQAYARHVLVLHDDNLVVWRRWRRLPTIALVLKPPNRITRVVQIYFLHRVGDDAGFRQVLPEALRGPPKLLLVELLGRAAHLEAKANIGAFIRLALQSDPAAHTLRELLGSRQADTDARGFELAQAGLAEGREKLFQVAWLDARARVDDLRQ